MERWFAGLPPAETTIGCSGSLHRVSWRRGKLVLHDHDLHDEQVVLALGGEPPPCVAVLLAWRDRDGWDRALRPPPAGFVRTVRPPAVPDPLREVRRLGVVRRWERHHRRSPDAGLVEDLFRVLRRSAIGPLTEALEHARRERGGGRVTYVEVRLARIDAAPSVEGRIDERSSSLLAHLHPSWLYLHQPAAAGGARHEFLLDRTTQLAWEPTADGGWRAYSALRS